MAKPRKPDTARKPPVPSDSHADIEDWIRRVMPDLHPIVKRLDESVREGSLTVEGDRIGLEKGGQAVMNDRSNGTGAASRAVSRFALLLTASVLGGCSGDGDPGTDVIRVSDDGGVPGAVVERLWSSEWPELTGTAIDTVIAPAEGDALGLVAPLYAAGLDDGRLVIGDAGSAQIWIEEEGGGWRSGPSRGAGPAELRGVDGVWATGSGFIVFDRLAGELVRYAIDGSWIERIPAATGGAGAGGPWPVRLLSLGEEGWLTSIPGPPEPSGTLLRSRLGFAVHGGGAGADEVPPSGVALGEGPARPMFVAGGGGAPIPFSRTAMSAAAGGRVILHSGEDPEVREFDAAGEVRFLLRWDDPPRTFDRVHRDALGTFLRSAAPPGAPAEAAERMAAELGAVMPFPEFLPHLGDLRRGPDGSIWLGWPERSGLELPTMPELVREWRVFHRGDSAAAPRILRVTLPEGATLLGPVEEGAVSLPAGSERAGAFFVLLRDELDRQGLGILRFELGG